MRPCRWAEGALGIIPANNLSMWISGLYGAGKLLSEPQYNLESSKETRVYLATRPNQFKYVLAPTHGSWLNIVETFLAR